jgi:hypothetical protein
MFISLESSYLVSQERAAILRQLSAIPGSLSGDSLSRQDKLCSYGFLTNFKFPPDQAAVNE